MQVVLLDEKMMAIGEDSETILIPRLLELHARHTPHAEAIIAIGRTPLTYQALWDQVNDVGAQLRAWGIGRHVRVALLLPTGPELAVCLLSVMATATVTALNPASGPTDLEAALTTSHINVVIVPDVCDQAMLTIIQALEIDVITLTALADAAAGLFTLRADMHGHAAADHVDPDDIAAIVRTSGTTSRPKVMPLTHRIVAIRARAFGHTARLTGDDRGLVLAPLYNNMGYFTLLAVVVSGGAIMCTAEPSAREFFAYLETCRPTWCSGVPTIYQAILVEAHHYSEIVQRHSLRFIRTSASALLPATREALETLFQVPVINGYSMSETGAIALDQGVPGSGATVIGIGLDVAIVDQQGAILGSNQTGEVVVRGPSVISGYENDPASNALAFRDGWFHTGDSGYLDNAGHLFLIGRFKEMINRGGEKISPLEVEEVLLAHPAVAQAAVFALPHATLGEDVCAAVVPRPGATLTERDVRLFVGHRLAAFKVPRQVVFLATLPLANGDKIQRLGLATRLGLNAVPMAAYAPPRDDWEESLAVTWAHILGMPRVGIHDNFFDLGGNSLLATQLCVAMEATVGQLLPATLLEAPTIAALGALLRQSNRPPALPTLVPLQPLGTRPPLFCVAYLGGSALGYRDLARLLGPQQPLYALQQPFDPHVDLAEQTIEDLAGAYLRAVRTVQPHGPYYLAGSSGGGVVAFEMARQLQALGEQVALLALFDSLCPSDPAQPSSHRRLLGYLQYYGRMATTRVRFHGIVWTTLPIQDRQAYLRQRLATVRRKLFPRHAPDVALPGTDVGHVAARRVAAGHVIIRAYAPRLYAGRVILFWSSDNLLGRLGAADPRLGWRRVAQGGLEIHYLPGSHSDFVYHADYLRQTVVELQACLRRARRAARDSLPH